MNILQRSDNWQSDRTGKITASVIKDLTAKPKTGKALNALLTQVLAERLTGQKEQGFVSRDMQWGIDNEPLAIASYENATGSFVVGCGLIDHPTIAMSGASPDGLIGDDGLIEVKCPNTTTHINTLLTNEVPSEYMPQMQWQMACTKRAWCDFVSFDPRMPENLQIKIIRVMRDDEVIGELESEVIKANEVLEKAKEELGV